MSPTFFSGCVASGSFFAIACYVSDAYDVAGRFYDWEWCDIGCRSSGCDALRGAGSAKQGACKRFRRVCRKNVLDPASPLDQLYRQHASDCVPPPLQHINSHVTRLIPHNKALCVFFYSSFLFLFFLHLCLHFLKYFFSHLCVCYHSADKVLCFYLYMCVNVCV